MAIMIKGMEMPENCNECPCLGGDSWNLMRAYQCNIMLQGGIGDGRPEWWPLGDGRPEWCPLVEVPEDDMR